MRIHVNGRNIEITEAIKAYVKEKIGKVATHYDQIQGIEVILSVIKTFIVIFPFVILLIFQLRL